MHANAAFLRGRLRTPHIVFAEACRILEAPRPDPPPNGRATDPIVGSPYPHLLFASWWAGYPDEAVVNAAAGIASAESRCDPYVLAIALSATALLHMWRRDVVSTLETARRALRVATEAGSLFWRTRAMLLVHQASATLDPSSAETHFEALSKGLGALLSSSPMGKTTFTSSIVDVYVRAGRRKRALQEIVEAIAFADASDERLWEAELHRLRGELLKDTDPAGAKRSIATAIDVARSQGAKSFELRATVSLHGVATTVRERKESREALQRLYESFTEGFGTRDLMEARSILTTSSVA